MMDSAGIHPRLYVKPSVSLYHRRVVSVLADRDRHH